MHLKTTTFQDVRGFRIILRGAKVLPLNCTVVNRIPKKIMRGQYLCSKKPSLLYNCGSIELRQYGLHQNYCSLHSSTPSTQNDASHLLILSITKQTPCKNHLLRRDISNTQIKLVFLPFAQHLKRGTSRSVCFDRS